MKRPNITPGNWKISPAELKVFGTSNVYSETPGCVTLGCSALKESKENAIAIASVPKLLAALESALNTLEDCETCDLATAREVKAALIEAGYTFD